LSKPQTTLAPLAVYVHWPYCARICPYCDFNVVRAGRGEDAQALAGAILADMEGQAALTGPRRLSSIFFGGGTPSLMAPDHVAEIIAAARRLWPSDGEVEISLEANPTDAEAGRFAGFAEAGVNRLSLGVQALDDAALAFLGRNHSADEARRAAKVAAAIFPRLSLDLIYARPDQSLGAWTAELAEAAGLGCEHISPYQLTIEPGTAFDRAVQRGAIVPPGPEKGAAFYETTAKVLSGLGFEAYEVSNHARGAGARSVHNLAYWRGWDYVGAGPGAHGRLTTGDGRIATECARAVSDYVHAVKETGVGVCLREPLDDEAAATERLLMGLRTHEGVGFDELRGLVLDTARIADFRSAGLLVANAERLIATDRGRAVLDRLTADLIV
jgi:putative oxygen-independent coproporphyrinogen III oxidase